MSGEETVRQIREEREARCVALRDNIRDAQGAMAAAGFAVAASTSPWDMVTNLLARNADQKKIEDGLRERLKIAAEFSGTVIETEARFNAGCVFCNGDTMCRAGGGYRLCANVSAKNPSVHYEPCALDEGPILVKNAGDEQTCGSEGNRGREATTAPCPGGDRSNGPQSPG